MNKLDEISLPNKLCNIKKEFPILTQTFNGKTITYLDTAASSQKPKKVINTIKDTYEQSYANVHRGIYKLSQIATDKYEEARSKVSNFLNVKNSEEIIFTRGATEGINLVANCLSEYCLVEGDEIILSTLEHHSNIIPWQMAAKRTGANIVELKPDKDGNIFVQDFKNLITEKTKVIALPHITNSIGSILDIEEICNEAKKRNIISLIDGCQAAPHLKIDLKKIDPDFYVFSGHKLYGPSGIGVLFGKKKYLDQFMPYQTGGEMIDFVSIKESTFTKIPNKFEAGTPNIVGAISLGSAIDFIEELGINNIHQHSSDLTKYLVYKFKSLNFIKIIGNPIKRLGIVPFLIEGSHPHDIALLLDSRGIALRAGHHCAQPAMRHFNAETTLRASFGVYNNEEDIDFLIANLKEIRKYF